MDKPIKLIEKYERNGWPSLKRPDLNPPEGWNLSLLTSLERIRSHALSPDGKAIAYIKDGESLSDVYLLPVNGSWLHESPPIDPSPIIGMTRFRPGRPMGDGWRSALKDMFILCRGREACPERSPTSPPPPVVPASCPIPRG